MNSALRRAWRSTIRVKGDYARTHAQIIAMAASLSLITTKVGVSTFANSWHITQKGLAWLNEQDN